MGKSLWKVIWQYLTKFKNVHNPVIKQFYFWELILKADPQMGEMPCVQDHSTLLYKLRHICTLEYQTNKQKECTGMKLSPTWHCSVRVEGEKQNTGSK